jgi:hypothetical protein
MALASHWLEYFGAGMPTAEGMTNVALPILSEALQHANQLLSWVNYTPLAVSES